MFFSKRILKSQIACLNPTRMRQTAHLGKSAKRPTGLLQLPLIVLWLLDISAFMSESAICLVRNAQ
jgi:hypothetical protein